jgi:hypothetical protein
MRKPRKISLAALTNRPTISYRERILNSFGGATNFMNANRINPDHVLAKSWMSFKLAEMETTEQERGERAGSEAGAELGSYGVENLEEVGQGESSATAGAGKKGQRGKGKKNRREEGVVSGVAKAMSKQLFGIKQEPNDDEQELQTLLKKRGRRGGKGVVGKFGGMENFMNSRGIRPYDDGAVEDINAILDLLRGIKQESGASNQATGRVVKKKKKKSGKGKRGKRVF